MTSYAAHITLTLQHAFYRTDPIPLRATLAEACEREGYMLRNRAGRVLVIGPDDDGQRLDRVEVNLVATTPDVFRVTGGADPRASAFLDVPLEQDSIRFAMPEPTGNDQARVFSGVLATLSIAVPQNGSRHVTVSFDTVETVWAYFIVGRQGDEALEVFDTGKAVEFEDLGRSDLPNGRNARVFRSRQALPMRDRPPQRFALRRVEDTIPHTLMHVLPAPGLEMALAEGPDGAPRMQSNIYVSL